MSDYISKSALVENIKAEIKRMEKEKQQYFEQGNFRNGKILFDKIQAMKLAMKIVANEPTISETAIIRKAFERVVERLEWFEDRFKKNSHLENWDSYVRAFEKAIEIVKEECGINE